jgi:hypothetical protein
LSTRLISVIPIMNSIFHDEFFLFNPHILPRILPTMHHNIFQDKFLFFKPVILPPLWYHTQYNISLERLLQSLCPNNLTLEERLLNRYTKELTDGLFSENTMSIGSTITTNSHHYQTEHVIQMKKSKRYEIESILYDEGVDLIYIKENTTNQTYILTIKLLYGEYKAFGIILNTHFRNTWMNVEPDFDEYKKILDKKK